MDELADSSAVARKLATGRRSVIATPAYLQKHGMPLVPVDLATHQAVVYTQLGNSWTFRRDGTEASVAVSGRARFSAAEGLRVSVLADMGLAIASDWMFWPELQSGQAVRLLQDWDLPSLDLWAVFPTGRLASAKARAFADFTAGILG
jgi:DNA-binding transcriptional LysR family regulator